MRCEEGADVGDDGAVEAANHNLIALMQHAIDKDHIDGGAKPLNHLDLEYRALQLADEHQALRHHGLRDNSKDQSMPVCSTAAQWRTQAETRACRHAALRGLMQLSRDDRTAQLPMQMRS